MALIKASHRHARIAATKIRPFADMIRGKTVAEGTRALLYVPNRGAKFLAKVLKSAAANAEDRGARNVDQLIIKDARVDGGPMFKRIKPMSRGQAFMIRRRFAHVHVAVDAPEIAEKS
ncbi:MAG TPA: 50S ribosomal protein L22 [Caulifigura sp.]|jgi:large subunit ribosomal protein L22|nr:50S ribosomal protein L22 [Caulifigura sp.]